MSRHNTILSSRLLLTSSLAVAMIFGACGGKKGTGKGEGDKASGKSKSAAVMGAPAEAKVPAETAPLALDQGNNKIPATITVPKGSTIFADSPTMLRVSYGKGRKKGRAFGVQVHKGNKYNTNLKKSAKGLAENKYGNTNKILEQTDTLLRYTMSRDGRTSHKFTLLVDLKGTKWVCTQGNYGGWNAKQAARQLAACRTLKAK